MRKWEGKGGKMEGEERVKLWGGQEVRGGGKGRFRERKGVEIERE